MKKKIQVGTLVQYKEKAFFRGTVIGISTSRIVRNGKRVTVHVVTIQLSENSYFTCTKDELTTVGD